MRVDRAAHLARRLGTLLTERSVLASGAMALEFLATFARLESFLPAELLRAGVDLQSAQRFRAGHAATLAWAGGGALRDLQLRKTPAAHRLETGELALTAAAALPWMDEETSAQVRSELELVSAIVSAAPAVFLPLSQLAADRLGDEAAPAEAGGANARPRPP